MFIPIPSGLTLPEDSDVKPFDLSGKFIVANGKLVPLMIGGQKISMEEEESEDEEYESEEGGEESEDGMGEMEHGGGCSCPDCEGKKKGNGFMVAIETAMRPKK
jgi:hypothetical protein